MSQHVPRSACAHAAALLLLCCSMLSCCSAGRVLTQTPGLYVPNLPANSPEPTAGTPGLYVPFVLPSPSDSTPSDSLPAEPSPTPTASPSPPSPSPPLEPDPSPTPELQPTLPSPSPPPEPNPSPTPQPQPTLPSPSPPPQPEPSPTPPVPTPVTPQQPQQQQPSEQTPQQQQQQNPQQQQPAAQRPVTEAGPVVAQPTAAVTTTTSQSTPVGTPPATSVYGTSPTSPQGSANGSGSSSGSSRSGGGLSTGALIGICVGGAAAAIIAAAICAVVLIRHRRQRDCSAAATALLKPTGLPSAFGSTSGPYDHPPGGPGGGPGERPDGPGGASFPQVLAGGVFGPKAVPHKLPGSVTAPVPPAVHLEEPPVRWSSGPAALSDADVTPNAPTGSAFKAAGASTPPAAETGLEGWLASGKAAAAAQSPRAAAGSPAAPTYPLIDPLKSVLGHSDPCPRPPTTGYFRGPLATQHQQDPWLTPAIPEDAPLPSSSNGTVMPFAGTAASSRRSSDRLMQLRPGSPRTPSSPAAAAAAALTAAAAAAVSGGDNSRDGGVSLGPFAAAGLMQARQLSWEQMMQQSGSCTSSTAAAAAARDASPKQQQQWSPQVADDTTPVADIGASPFAHMFGAAAAAAAGLGSIVMTRDASAPLSPLPAPAGAAGQQGHPLALEGVRQTTAAAPPAGATATAVPAVIGCTASPAGAGGSRAGGWPAGSGVHTAASPFAAGLPAFDDGSLSAAVAAAAAAAIERAHNGRSTPEGHSRASGCSSNSSSKPGGRPPRFSTDTGTSNSAAAAGQSWTSSVSSTTPTLQAPPPSAATPPATAHSPRAGPSAAVLQAGSPGRAGSGGGGPAPAGLALQASVAAKPTRYMSGPRMDPHWDFGQTEVKPVRVMLQVNLEDEDRPVSLILMCSAPPPRPEVLAQIVLPADPPQAGVDLAIDANRDLAFPSNSFLGAGAFGQVHRALYRGRHPVAVKMLTDPGLRSPDEDTLRSFREELQIMSKLDHPHILRCYGGNLEGANPFIVTELCECSLDKMILYYKTQHSTGLPLRHTLMVGLHVASALWHLHPSIVHRDLKPQNVLLDIHGTAKVADFGLSRIKMHTYLSTTHVAAGTASYMSPECFAGGHVGEKADVYSLGCMLWECVTGERPWKGYNVVQVAYQVAMAKNKPPLPAIDPGSCPHELVTLLDDCFSFNPKERPSSGEVMKLMAHMIRAHLPEMA